MPLLHLPNELLLLIADYLDYKSHARLLRTNRHLQKLLTHLLYRRILSEDGGVRALRFAALHNSTAVATLFLTEHCVSPDIPLHDTLSCHYELNYHSPLHLCANNGSADVMKVFLDHGANPNIRNASQRTPLHTAAATNKIVSTQLLLSRGADATMRDDLEQTPLHLAAKKGHAGIVSILLEEPGVGVDDTCKDPQNEVDGGYTALHGAADFGHVEVARVLLQKGAQVDAKIEQSEWTPLGCAAAEGYEELVRLLLEWGAEVNVTPEVPLRLAVDGKWCDGVLRLLLERGASVDSAIHGLYHAETANRLVEFAESLRKNKEEPADTVMGESSRSEEETVQEEHHGHGMGLMPMEGIMA